MKDKKKNQSKANRLGGRGKSEFMMKESDEDPFLRYGFVQSLLGDGRCRVMCDDNVSRVCRIRGAIRGRAHIANNDIVLISLRDISTPGSDKVIVANDGADLVYKYTPDDVHTLRKDKHIPSSFGVATLLGSASVADGDGQASAPGASGSDRVDDTSTIIVFEDI